MDLTPVRPWLTLVHILAAFAFVFVHGASSMVAFKLRSERDRKRIQALLELSNAYLNALYVAFLVLFAAGILAGIAGGHWTSGRTWIWAALILLIVVTVLMYVIPAPYFEELRHALGMATFNDVRKKLEPPPPVSDAELERLLLSPRPLQTAAVGIVGLGVIIWLMVMKPF